MPAEIKRQFRIITEQHILPDVPQEVEGFPMRAWSVEIHMLDDNGNLVPASVFEKVTYELHPTFPKPKQPFKKPPFRIDERGWGEFDMILRCVLVGRGPIADREYPISHDLNFQSERYEATHTLTFRNPKPELLAVLEQLGVSVENGVKKGSSGGSAAAQKKSRKEKNVDMEKLADGLQKLSEDDLLHVVQLVHDNKTADTYTKNDVENGEFHVDLYTLPDSLVKQLWDFTSSKVDM
ncbi:uncharacterized protein PV09_08269 [Verruconis gallopava]|uniref:YEATS domain-containing protein n=1 Tax=Verruconis gallopava TaxID=253628 RepID=A0A0D1XDB8_9PEZI|nr:uncharacterized protein PV09_08269 [Verruconis gallopava]KIW00231.1 hypothetical protein PV09_08269 [Verruconis gallopava]